MALATQTVSVDIVEYLYLAEVVARKYYRGKDRIRDTDLFSVACQALVRCSQKYDPDLGPFDRFAMRAMRNEIVQYIRLNNAKKRVVEFEVLEEKDWEKVESSESEIEFSPSISELLADSPSESEEDRADKQLVKDVYLDNKQITDIAEQLNVSRVTIYNRLRKAVNKLRGKFDDNTKR
jgi:RNA polymerase sigma factor (sigma-70 family)